jgi:hypothetical protein
LLVSEKHFAKKANVMLSGPPDTATARLSLDFITLENSLYIFNIFLLLR